MKTRILVSDQVESFIKSLAPHPRRALRQAVKSLADDCGGTKALEEPLTGFHRLRVTRYRVIYSERFEAGQRVIDCIFAEERSVVYEIFTHLALEIRPPGSGT